MEYFKYIMEVHFFRLGVVLKSLKRLTWATFG